MRMPFVALFLLSFMAVPGLADAKAPKIAYVDVARALNDVDDGQNAKKKLKAEFDARQTKLDKLQNELKAKKDEFDKKSAMMKPDVRAAKQEELQRSFYELQQTYMQLQQELLGQENKLTQEIAGKLRAVVAKVGDRDSYDIIFDIGETVLYYKRHQDITDEVVREYNRQYGKK